MSFIAWIVLGLIAGFIASKLVNKSGEGILLDIILGIIGAVVGGYLFNTFGMAVYRASTSIVWLLPWSAP